MLEGGCSSKLRYSKLIPLIAGLKSNSISDAHLDATELSFSSDYVTSIDTVVSLVADEWKDFGILAVSHCLNDIYSSKSVPIDANVSVQICFKASAGAGKQLIEGIAEALSSHGVRFGKGHSIFGETTLVTVSVIGRRLPTLDRLWPAEEYRLFLTKKLGASRLYQLAKLSGDTNAKAFAFEYMSRNPGSLARLISSFSTASVDVSGFGLAGSVLQLKEQFSQFSFLLYASSFSRVDSEFGFARTSCSYDDNLEDFLNYFEIATEIDETIKQSLFGREFCGPLLSAIPHASCEAFLVAAKAAALEPIEIGLITKDNRAQGKVTVAQ